MSKSASAGASCPHCGEPLAGSLPQHMARGACGEYTSPSTAPQEHTDHDYPDPPLLENHDELEHGDHDLDERRALADELAEAGVWC